MNEYHKVLTLKIIKKNFFKEKNLFNKLFKYLNSKN